MLHAALQCVLVVLLVGGAVAGSKRLVATRPSVPTQAAAEPSYAVESVLAKLGANTPLIEVFGQVHARNSVELRALVAGTVSEVAENLKVGARVSAGHALVSIDPFAYEGAVTEARANLAESQAQLDEARARLTSERDNLSRAQEQFTFAERELQRTLDLRRRSMVPEQSVDDARLSASQQRQARDAATHTQWPSRAPG